MKPLKLCVQAFGPYKGRTEIDFRELEDQNLFLITGATGSGKTTIFDAICYALYGVSSGQYRSERNLRCQNAPDELLTSISYEFLLKDKVYRVERSPKQLKKKSRGEGYTEIGPKATLVRPESEEPITGAKMVTQSIESLIGLKVEQFRQIMMIPQGEFRKLLMAKSEDRSLILKNIFNTHLYGTIQSQIKEEKRNIESSIKKVLEARLGEINHIQVDVESEEGQLLQASIDAEHQNIKLLINNVQIQNDLDQQQIKKIIKEYDDLKATLETMIKDKTQAEINNKNIDTYHEYLQHLEVLESQSDEIKSKEALLKKIRNVEKIYPQYETYLNLKSELEKINENIKTYNQLLDTLKKEHITIEKQYQLTHSEEYKKNLDALTIELNDYQKYEKQWLDLVEFKSNYDVLKTETDKKTNGYTQLLLEKESIEKEIKIINEFLTEHKDLAIQKIQISKKKDEISTTLTELEKYFDKHCQLIEIQKQLLEISETFAQMKVTENKEQTAYKEMKHYYHLNQAAVLAQELEKNMPCPVCGSKEHIQLAKFSGKEISIEHLEAQEALIAKCSSDLVHQEAKMTMLKDKEDECVKILDELSKWIMHLEDQNFNQEIGLPLENVQLIKASYKDQLHLVQEEISNIETLSKKYDEMQLSYEKTINKSEKLSNQMNEVKAEIDVNDKEIQKIKVQMDFIEDQMPNKIKEKPIADQIASINSEIDVIKTQQQTALDALNVSQNNMLKKETQINGFMKHREDLTLKEEETKTLYMTLLAEASISEQAFIELVDKIPESENIQKVIETYKQEIHGIKKSLSDLKSTITHTEKQSIEAFNIKIDEINHHEKEISEKLSSLKNRIKTNNDQIERITMHTDKIVDKEEQYHMIGHLSDVLNGKNKKNLSFERFILSKYLEEILDVANLKLLYMTNNRFTLQISDTIEDARSGAGLDLEVIDSFTGMPRSVKTLSGGESFKASLSMALGLAEVVQAYAGGIQLDTIFIDEGFGTLDQESLDSAINCLIDLQETGRLVGIISHVQELKERVKTQLIISQSSNGSDCKFVI